MSDDGVKIVSTSNRAVIVKETVLPIVLLAITIVTTTLAGALMNPTDKLDLTWYLSGFRFSVPLLLILGIHESAHYIASKRLGVAATPPYFIPAPTFIGTFGAVIRIKGQIPNKRALVAIGAAGPIAGFIVALPVLIYGIYISKIASVAIPNTGGIQLGESLALKLFTLLIKGRIPQGLELYLSTEAFAGWLGLFVTSLNLLPIGQLDGGHVFYAVFGDKGKRVSDFLIIVMALMGYFWLGWLFWAFLLYFLLGKKHPPTIDESIALGLTDKIVCIVCAIIFVLTLMPVPFG
jgi:membrane-associated protease RseP (regulator of RpoE activity)